MISSGFRKSLERLVSILLVMMIAGTARTVQGPANPQTAYALADSIVYMPFLETQEAWTFHKTADGQHPDGNEQQMMWLMNRARANPTQEGVWLATTTEPDVAGGRTYFGVNLNLLKSEFASYAAKPPAAFDVRLYNAAKAHSDDLIARNAQDHTNQFQRVTDAGFAFSSIRGNVFSYSDNGLNAHGAFNIDWGNDTDGMQASRGHRKAIMSLDNDYYSNVGIAVVPVTVPGKTVGPYVTTGNYAHPNTSAANEYHRFIVGTVWRDLDGNGLYDPGEGYANVTVTPNTGKYYAITALSGGYAIPILAPGTYTVTFAGAVSGVQQVVVGDTSVLVDFKVATGSAPLSEPLLEPTTPARTPVAPPPGIAE